VRLQLVNCPYVLVNKETIKIVDLRVTPQIRKGRQVVLMQDFTVAFGRVTRATFSANPEMKSHVTELMGRAYFNLHAQPLNTADTQWCSAIIAAGMQLCLDERAKQLNPRELIQLFENVIRVSEEHLREAKRHAAMGCNVFYLKETALDASLFEHSQAPDYAASTVLGLKIAIPTRVSNPQDSDA